MRLEEDLPLRDRSREMYFAQPLNRFRCALFYGSRGGGAKTRKESEPRYHEEPFPVGLLAFLQSTIRCSQRYLGSEEWTIHAPGGENFGQELYYVVIMVQYLIYDGQWAIVIA